MRRTNQQREVVECDELIDTTFNEFVRNGTRCREKSEWSDNTSTMFETTNEATLFIGADFSYRKIGTQHYGQCYGHRWKNEKLMRKQQERQHHNNHKYGLSLPFFFFILNGSIVVVAICIMPCEFAHLLCYLV